MKKFSLYFGFCLVSLLILIALFAPLFAPHDPNLFDLERQLMPPNAGFWFGHDSFGRCVFSRVLFGARISLLVGILVVSISLSIGLFVGVLAGWRGGVFDHCFLFLSDIFLAFPGFLLAIAMAAFVGPSLGNVIFILSLLGWVSYARLARGQTLGLKQKEFILASKSLGASSPRLIVKHLLPNLMAPMIVQATFGMAGVVLVEASLSFLGLGVPIQIPSWGNMLDEGTSYLLIAPHLSIFPGIFMMLLILGFNFLGDGLQDYLNPRAKAGIKNHVR